MQHDCKIEISLAEFIGKIKTDIEYFAPTIGLLPVEVATRIAPILNGAPIWTLLGIPNSVRHMRGASPKASKGERSEVEVDVRPLKTGTRKVAHKKRSGVNRGSWFAKLSKKKQKEVIEKRKASMAKTMAERKVKENAA